MALIATKYVDSTLEIPAEWSEATEQVGGITTQLGYYVHPQNEDEVLISSKRIVLNKYGTEIRRDEEEWMYEVYKGPPIEYKRECWSNVYLPGIGGRTLRKVEEEEVVYWPFTPFTDGDNLGCTRFLSAYVVYDLPLDPTKATTGDEQDSQQGAGLKPTTINGRIIHSGKLWVNANMDNSVIPQSGTKQSTIWVPHVIVEHDIIDEEPDRWIIWTVRKHALRSGAVEVIGPKEIKKTGFTYRLPYPIGPPKLKSLSSTGGVYSEIFGGGALITNRWIPANKFSIKPEKYKLYRKKLSEPERSPADDPYGWWKTPPTIPDKTGSIIETTAVVDFDGDPASALPGQTTFDEPHDPEPVDPPEEAAFILIATADNMKDRNKDEGWADYLDTDVVDGGEYEYYATAVIGDDESPESNHQIILFNGTADRRLRISKRVTEEGAVETDAAAPDDPSIPQEDFGEIAEFEIHTTDDPIEVTEEIAERQFAVASNEDQEITLDILIPLLGLEYGQKVILPQVVWKALGSGIEMTSQTIGDEYMLKGFTLKVARDNNGKWSSQKTILLLQEHSW